jgi:hypothetical protein
MISRILKNPENLRDLYRDIIMCWVKIGEGQLQTLFFIYLFYFVVANIRKPIIRG